MSGVVPDPVPLDQPDEDPAALADVLSALTGAAFRMGLLEVHLAGPAATAPEWLGDDAAAAAAQVGVAAAVVRNSHASLTTAVDRLRQHAELLDETRRGVAALVVRQDEDLAAAIVRGADPAHHPAAAWDPAQALPVTVVDGEFRVADAARARAHAVLLDRLHADAVATARVLTGCVRAVGGTGRAGDAERVVAQLAAQLPGWGDGELSARGAELASELLWALTPQEREARARAARPYAGTQPFADAVLRGLGPAGLRWLLGALPVEDLGVGSATAAVLAQVLGGARRSGTVVDPVGDVLDARYVDPRAPGIDDDLVAVGMAAVLAAAARGAGSLPPATAAAWGRQVLRREQTLRESGEEVYRAVDRVGPDDAPVLAADPVTDVLGLLAGGNDAQAAADLLGDRTVWEALLGRRWTDFPDDAAALVRVVEEAGTVLGAAGETAVRAGLEALGTGLADGDADHWPADPATAALLSLPLATGVAAHVDAAVDLLAAAARGGEPSNQDAAALRGLGYVTLDAGATDRLRAALRGWAAGRRSSADPLSDGAPDPVMTALGSYVAVREYGQRLAYVLHCSERRDAALAAADLFNWTVGLTAFIPGWFGEVAGAVTPWLAHWWGADGTWDDGVDDGPRFGVEDAVAFASVAPAPDRVQEATVALADQARAGYVGAASALDLPKAPESPDWDPLMVALDSVPTLEVRLHVLEGYKKWLSRTDGAVHSGASAGAHAASPPVG